MKDVKGTRGGGRTKQEEEQGSKEARCEEKETQRGEKGRGVASDCQPTEGT